MTLTEKETSLLKDMTNQEQLCIDKYNKYAKEACDKNLKDLFTSLSKVEQEHLQTVTKILGGTVPSISNSIPTSTPKPKNTCTYDSLDDSDARNHDKFLCSDCLASEKHVASFYNTSVFEFKDSEVRKALNHIQTEEQQHGESIYNYMNMNGMYES